MASVLSFDLSPSLCGWCFAGQDGTLLADAFALPALGADLGGLAAALQAQVEALIDRFHPTQMAYEAPLLLRHDSLIDLRKIYGLGVVLELLAHREGLAISEMDPKRVKTAMTGDPFAHKRDVVEAALRLGVTLPATKAQGREDAADAVGVAVVQMSVSDPAAASPWVAILRNSLL